MASPQRQQRKESKDVKDITPPLPQVPSVHAAQQKQVAKSTPSTGVMEEEDILKEICTSNGINYIRLSQEGQACTCVEMFFNGVPRIVGMQRFPNLQVLCLVGQTIKKIEGLVPLTQLKELWISESEVEKIEGLDSLTALQKLYLYSCRISKIENIGHLTHLELLWLNDNNISIIENLSCLKRLKDLNLADNNIEKIGSSLIGLQSLEKLELSGNNISSFKDLTNLCRLSNLEELGLKSPMYQPCPVGLLCNYSTQMLFHLPHLNRLDTWEVSNKAIKDLAETTVLKKKMYYHMKMKMMWRQFADQKKKLTKLQDEILKTPCGRLRALVFAMKEIQRELQELKQEEDTDTHDSGTESDKDAREAKAAEGRGAIGMLKAKQKALKERVKKWERKIAEVEHFHKETTTRMKQLAETVVQRLETELETGGNVRFEDGKPSDVWFTSCHDLILSRFCAADYRGQGIVGIKVHSITRIHNRCLRARFEDKLAEHVDDDDVYASATKSSSCKKLMEYLFWVWDPELPGGLHEPSRVLEDGFLDAETYKQIGKDPAVPLTNSLSLADWHRIQYTTKIAKGKEFFDLCPFRHGQVIVAKVYLGMSSQHSGNNQVCPGDHPNADSVYRPRHTESKSGKTEQEPSAETSSTSSLSGGVHSAIAGKSSCDCNGRQCEWFIFDHELVLPEYVIDFEYITRMKPKSPFTSQSVNILDSKESKPLAVTEDLPTDEDVLEMAPLVKPRPRLITLSEELLLRTTKATSLLGITTLNLHGNGLTKLKYLSSLPVLKKLVVSFNELVKLDDMSHLNLEYLDASFNKITTLEGFKSMNKLKHLDLSWNQLRNTRDDISILRKHASGLETLDLRHNHWQKPDGLRLRAIGRIKSLVKLNGARVTEEEAASALRMAAGSRISQVSLLAHSRRDTHRPHTLSLMSFAQVICSYSRKKLDRVNEQDNLWYPKVTTLNLDSQHISKLSNLERLENLRWASFNDNDITKIEGLEACSNLEELSLENNCITKIEGLSKLTRLRRLSLGNNYISKLDGVGLEQLTRMEYLSLESNRITSFLGLQRLNSLVELYIGNNLIDSSREIFYLKSLVSLLILDLGGNPISASTDNYRLFVVYHLKTLKALDGTPIELTEANQAKDTFGGRLTQDFVAEKLEHANFPEVKELDFPQCSIRIVDLTPIEMFLNLRSVNLEQNNMTSFSGLIYLTNLRVLCLNHNHIECIIPRPKAQQGGASKGRGGAGGGGGMTGSQHLASFFNPEAFTPVLENLEVLHLGYNGIKDLAGVQLNRLPSLKALFLQGNEISKIEGLEGLQDLRELVLDRNRVKNIGEYSFMNQWNLTELHLEENRLRDVVNLDCLENLQRLFLGMNKIQDIGELERLQFHPRLVELSLVSNPVARRSLHRPVLVFRMPSLMVLDGIPISDEERAKIEIFQQDLQQAQMPIGTTIETNLPTLGKSQVSVKVTNMQLVSGPYYDRNWAGTLNYTEEALQQELQRGRKKNSRNDPISMPVQLPNPNKTGGTINYQHSSSQGGIPGAYGVSRAQYQNSQVPYVPHQQGDYVSGQSETRTQRNPRR